MGADVRCGLGKEWRPCRCVGQRHSPRPGEAAATRHPIPPIRHRLMGGPGAVPRLRSRLHEGAASLGECDASLWVVYAVKVGIDG